MTSLASIEVDSLTIYGNQFEPNNAVPKSYVDTAVDGATTRIDTILAGSSDAFDTLIELKTLMDDTSSTLGTALTTKVAELSSAIQTEATTRSGAVSLLQTDLATETQLRQGEVQVVRDAIDQELLARETEVLRVENALGAESLRAQEAEAANFNQIEAVATTNNDRINEFEIKTADDLATKFDKAPGYLTRSDGALEIDNDHYLYLGSNWRLRASQGTSKRRRLEFEHSDDMSTWQLAVPFIRGGD